MPFSEEEIQWLLDKRITRYTDNEEILIYPMGSERYLRTVLIKKPQNRYPIYNDIHNKHIVVIPGYGNTGFIFAEAGARTVTVYDADPVTIAWLKAFYQFYYYKPLPPPSPSIAECLQALTAWYPPYLSIPGARLENSLYFIVLPQYLRRAYILYMMQIVQTAIHQSIHNCYACDLPITFHVGTVAELTKTKATFDTAYVPYLLGVRNGITDPANIIETVISLLQRVPQGKLLVTPAFSRREYYWFGQRYAIFGLQYHSLDALPDLAPYCIARDTRWFHTQGLNAFSLSEGNVSISIQNCPPVSVKN